MKNKILLITLTALIILTGCKTQKQEENKELVETNGMISYTIDGELTSVKPTKENGYIVNKIICDKGSDLMWDNDNWEAELTEVKSKDRCMVDFTKDASTPGYRVTVTSNSTSSLDSLSKATTENGTVVIYSKATIKNVTGCNGTIEANKVVVKNVIENQICNITIEQTLADTIKAMYPPKAGRTDFSIIDDGAPGLYTGVDNQGTTYYFSGNGRNMNNWVSFAGKLWRIIRINGNESVRLLYAGTGGEDGYISLSKYNEDHINPAYVGWKYAVDGENGRGDIESTIFAVVNKWYEGENGLTNEQRKYIDEKAIYCNNRMASYSDSFDSNYITFTARDKATTSYYFMGHKRLVNKYSPTFKCDNISDRFDKFGLMTADEVVAAGGLYNTENLNAYYILNVSNGSSTGKNPWWTMTPVSYLYSLSRTYDTIMFHVRTYVEEGKLTLSYTSDTNAIRPVISLKKEVLVTGGDGSSSSPYEVTLP